MQELLSALDSTPPSVDGKERKRYEKMYLIFSYSFCPFFSLIVPIHADFIQSRGDVSLVAQTGPRQTLA